MIYDIYWTMVGHPVLVNNWNQFQYPNTPVGKYVGLGKDKAAEFIKQSKDSSFIFVLSNRGGGQWGTFDDWVAEYGLEKYIQVDAPNISNPSHPEAPRTMRLVIMQSEDHFQHNEVKEKELVV